jgi:OOP family OmpA-OmpF porin
MSRRIILVVGAYLAATAALSVAGARAQTFYQGGFRYNVTPPVALDLDDRCLATTEATLRVPGTATRYSSGDNTDTLMASLVYRFSPPPLPPPVAAPPASPAPPPLPPVAQRQVFLVFFDWDRSALTAQGIQVIDRAAAADKAGAPVQL